MSAREKRPNFRANDYVLNSAIIAKTVNDKQFLWYMLTKIIPGNSQIEKAG